MAAPRRPAREARGHPAHHPQLERDRHAGLPDASWIEQARDRCPAVLVVLGPQAQVPGDRLAGEIGVDLHHPQVALGRAVRAVEVRRDHADQVTGVVDQGRGLDPAESRGGGDLPVRREARVGADIGDSGLRPLPGRPPAGRITIVDDGEVLAELRAEARLGDQTQGSGGRIDDLDVPEIPADERHRPPEDPREQSAQAWDVAQVLGQAMQAPGRIRLVQDEPHRRGEVLDSAGQPVPADRRQPRGRVTVSGLRPRHRLRKVLDPGRHHQPHISHSSSSVGASHPVRSVKRTGPNGPWLPLHGQGLVRTGQFDDPADRPRHRGQPHEPAPQLGVSPGGQERPQAGAVHERDRRTRRVGTSRCARA